MRWPRGDEPFDGTSCGRRVTFMVRWPSHRPGSRSEQLASGSLPLKIAGAYLVCGALWLVGAWFLVAHVGATMIEDATFVVGSSFVIYALVRHGVKTFRAKETDLRESEDRLARILETNASGVVVFDEAGRITFANHMACRVLGVDRAQIVGRRYDDPVWDLTDAGGAPILPGESPVARVRATGMPVHLATTSATSSSSTSSFNIFLAL